MPHTSAGRGNYNVRDEEDVFRILHCNPSTKRATGRLSQSAVWRRCSLGDNQLFPFHIQSVQSCFQGTDISVYSSPNGCYTRLWTPLNFCATCCGLTMQYFQEMVYTICATCMCGQRRILILLVTPHSSRNLVSAFGPEL
jgi:hypothetical protein